MALLKLNSKGSYVKAWQDFLKGRGFGLTPDGIFGPKTAECTRLFQLDRGLTADGIVGPATVEAAKKAGFNAAPATSKPSTKKIYLMSAGHTNVKGQDRGAVGSGYIEGVEAVKIRDSVAAKLRDRGFLVAEDGDDGENEPLKKALSLIAGTALAVEFHFNAAATPKATGVEVLCKDERKAEAQNIARAISNSLELPMRGELGWKPDSSGQHHRLAFCQRGGLIVEVCFISNPADMRAYSENFEAMTTAIANAIAG